jgi:rfaE bifunctional protein kinase chain/domain
VKLDTLAKDSEKKISEMRDLLIQTVDSLKGVEILVVGDVMIDRYLWGSVERISPEAPVPVVELQKTEDRLGGAGNLAMNLVQLGAKVSLCGYVGDDEEGEIALKLLEENSVKHSGVLINKKRPTTLKSRVIARSQQIVRLDREKIGVVEPELREGFSAVVNSHIENVKAVVLSDYGKGVISHELMNSLMLAQTSGKLGLSSRPLLIDPHPQNYSLYRKMSFVKPNRREAELASGIKIDSYENAYIAAKMLSERWNSDMVMISLSEDGIILYGPGDQYLTAPSHALQVFDVSGAGDTVVGTFTACLAAGASPEVSARIANVAAGIVVGKVGVATVTPEELKTAFVNW